MLALDPEWDQAAVRMFFSQNGISQDRTQELDFLDKRGFFVEGPEPGFPIPGTGQRSGRTRKA